MRGVSLVQRWTLLLRPLFSSRVMQPHFVLGWTADLLGVSCNDEDLVDFYLSSSSVRHRTSYKSYPQTQDGKAHYVTVFPQ
jgi:hypothetical protein